MVNVTGFLLVLVRWQTLDRLTISSPAVGALLLLRPSEGAGFGWMWGGVAHHCGAGSRSRPAARGRAGSQASDNPLMERPAETAALR